MQGWESSWGTYFHHFVNKWGVIDGIKLFTASTILICVLLSAPFLHMSPTQPLAPPFSPQLQITVSGVVSVAPRSEGHSQMHGCLIILCTSTQKATLDKDTLEITSSYHLNVNRLSMGSNLHLLLCKWANFPVSVLSLELACLVVWT